MVFLVSNNVSFLTSLQGELKSYWVTGKVVELLPGTLGGTLGTVDELAGGNPESTDAGFVLEGSLGADGLELRGVGDPEVARPKVNTPLLVAGTKEGVLGKRGVLPKADGV
jgi:hypothetical protein